MTLTVGPNAQKILDDMLYKLGSLEPKKGKIMNDVNTEIGQDLAEVNRSLAPERALTAEAVEALNEAAKEGEVTAVVQDADDTDTEVTA